MIFFNKLLIIIAITSLFFSNVFARSDYPMLVCPDLNQIRVDVVAGTASAPGGWVGQNAISLDNKDNWQSTVLGIEAIDNGTPYNNVPHTAECKYIAESEFIIDLKYPTLKIGYSLYNVNFGIPPVSGCIIEKAELNAGELKSCYWYSNPVLKK